VTSDRTAYKAKIPKTEGEITMERDQVMAEVRPFIEGFIGGEELKDTDNIFEMGYVNSMFAMQLVQFVETTFGISVDNDDLNIDNFNTVEHITDFVLRKMTN
jgi:acyl carrier protein